MGRSDDDAGSGRRAPPPTGADDVDIGTGRGRPTASRVRPESTIGGRGGAQAGAALPWPLPCPWKPWKRGVPPPSRVGPLSKKVLRGCASCHPIMVIHGDAQNPDPRWLATRQVRRCGRRVVERAPGDRREAANGPSGGEQNHRSCRWRGHDAQRTRTGAS